MAAKKKPKTFVRNGEVAFAYTPADEVTFTYNGWRERMPAPAPAADSADADTSAAPTKSASKKSD